MNSVDFRDDEIDLIELLEKIWDGRFTVLASVVIPIIAIVAYQFLKIDPIFEAQTPINKISSFDAEPYNSLNTLDIFPITTRQLHSLYIETLRDQDFIVQALSDIGILNAENYDSAEEYDTALRKKSAEIEVKRLEDNEQERFFMLAVSYTDQNIWTEAIANIDARANEAVRRALQRRFEQRVATDLLIRKFNLEDLNTSIENVQDDYDVEITNRVAYLEEQAQIARALQIAKNTLTSQTFDSEQVSITTITEDNAFYLRGYEAIEKEIELINNRSEKSNFITDLVDLHKQRRAINQDQTLERAQQLFSETPISESEQFKAANMSAFETSFEYNNNLILTTVIGAFLGGFIGIMLVIIRRAIKDRRKTSEV